MHVHDNTGWLPEVGWPTTVRGRMLGEKTEREVMVAYATTSGSPQVLPFPAPKAAETTPSPSKPADGPSVNAESDRRTNVLRALSREYMNGHDGVSPGLLAGTEWPPLDWMNQRLGELSEEWSVMAGKNSMELRFVERNAATKH